MNGPLEEQYFIWLCSKVNHVAVPTPSLTYKKLLRKLHGTEFVWLLSGDDNRAKDGVDLRQRFLLETGLNADKEWMNLGCSILEMFIAFSERIEFQTDVSAHEWFWVFVWNLGLSEYNDAKRVSEDRLDETLNSFIWRTYDPDGHGGIFPLQYPQEDQRMVEIWYQFCDYLIEQEQS